MSLQRFGIGFGDLKYPLRLPAKGSGRKTSPSEIIARSSAFPELRTFPGQLAPRRPPGLRRSSAALVTRELAYECLRCTARCPSRRSRSGGSLDREYGEAMIEVSRNVLPSPCDGDRDARSASAYVDLMSCEPPRRSKLRSSSTRRELRLQRGLSLADPRRGRTCRRPASSMRPASSVRAVNRPFRASKSSPRGATR